MSDLLSRDFKGIWIPKSIWLHPDLSLSAKCLWAEIHSLYKEEVGGCYASDDYLEEFLGVKKSWLHELLNVLMKAGLLIKVSFDGRKIIRKAIEPCECTGKQLSRSPESSTPENRTPALRKTGLPTYIENKDKRKVERESSAPALLFFGQSVRMPQTHYDALIADHGLSKITQYIERINNYCESSGKTYKGYAATIRNWIAKDAEKPVSKPAKKSSNDQISKSLNNDLEARFAAGGIEIHIDQYDLIQRKALKDNNPDYARGYRYKDSQGRMIKT